MGSEDPAFEPSPKASTMAGSMPLDLAAVEVVSALDLRAGGAILLKGSSFARWLYDSPGERFYGVDLHSSLVGITADPAIVWTVLSKHLERFKLLGEDTPILDEAARAMHVALHAAGHGDASGPLEDLERAVSRVDDATWRDAWSIAGELSADDAFSAGLWLSSGGAEVAQRLGVPRCKSVGVELRARSAPDAAQILGLISDARGISDRLAVLKNSLFPTSVSPAGLPTERRGRASVLASRSARVVVAFFEAIKAVPAWWRVRREVAKRVPTGSPATPRPSSTAAPRS